MSIPVLLSQRLALPALACGLAFCAAGLSLALGSPPTALAQGSTSEEVCSAAWLARIGPTYRVPRPQEGGSSMLGGAPMVGGSVAGGLGLGLRDRALEGPTVLGAPPMTPAQRDTAMRAQGHGPSDVFGGHAGLDDLDDLDDLDETNRLVTRPNDPYYSSQTSNLRAIVRAHEAWEISFGAPDVTIAIISDGVDLYHRDLAAKIWRNHDEIPANGIDDDGNGYVDDIRGWDFGTFDNDPSPISTGPRRVASTFNRGTMMAGIAAAETNNAYGIAGVSWGARIMPLKVMFPWPYRDGSIGGGSLPRNMVESVCYAANNGAQVILFGGFTIIQPNEEEAKNRSISGMQAAIEYATQQGALVVAPSGECGEITRRNDGFCPDPELYGENPALVPGAMERVVAVASIDGTYAQRDIASHGRWIDITAPGEGFYTTVNSENYDDVGSISPQHPNPSDFAAAHVAGAAALLRSANGHLSPLQLESQLCNMADRSRGGPYTGAPQHSSRFGCGVLDLERAIEQMPWRVDLPVTSLRHYIARGSKSATVRLSNTHLNERTWEIRQDVPWIADLPVSQLPGRPSQLELSVNMDALPGGLAAGDRYSTVLRACPVNDRNIYRDDERDCRPNAPSGCTCLDYELVILDAVPRIFLPFGTR